ncbi:unnamed protein product, partial [Polarella glacialis]
SLAGFQGAPVPPNLQPGCSGIMHRALQQQQLLLQRPAANMLPDQEFIPINTESPSLDRRHVFGDVPITSSLFSSPFAMFGPVTGYGEGPPGLGSDLLADLHADSQPVEHAATSRHKTDS